METADQLGARHAGVAAYAATLRALQAYSNAQGYWAIGAAGLVQRLRIQRDSTAACLDAYRKRGVIL